MFITLEGIDRSGKTTQAAMLAEALGPGTVLLREPGGTPAGERIRDLLKDPELELGPGTELLLFNAARAELCREVVRPALDDGHDVVCDRFIDSTVAYQGVARGLGVDVVERLSELVVGSCLPNLTVLLRVDPELAGARDGDASDRFESEGLEFQRQVAGAYDELASRHPERFEVVDATREPAAVHARILALVEARR